MSTFHPHQRHRADKSLLVLDSGREVSVGERGERCTAGSLLNHAMGTACSGQNLGYFLSCHIKLCTIQKMATADQGRDRVFRNRCCGKVCGRIWGLQNMVCSTQQVTTWWQGAHRQKTTRIHRLGKPSRLILHVFSVMC